MDGGIWILGFSMITGQIINLLGGMLNFLKELFITSVELTGRLNYFEKPE